MQKACTAGFVDFPWFVMLIRSSSGVKLRRATSDGFSPSSTEVILLKRPHSNLKQKSQACFDFVASFHKWLQMEKIIICVFTHNLFSNSFTLSDNMIPEWFGMSLRHFATTVFQTKTRIPIQKDYSFFLNPEYSLKTNIYFLKNLKYSF